LNSSDDAGVYKISDNLAIVQTVDFITPVVNDPYIFGQIAAANSLSDIFAMGAKFCTALNIVMFDNCNLTKEMLREILEGGLSKVKEAGGVILGGHTIQDIEMKYGLTATGIVNINKHVCNNTAKPGDLIILTKPIGIGVATTAIKADLADEAIIKESIKHMTTLNKKAAEISVDFGITAMTDVTGFGLLGHLKEMTTDKLSIELWTDNVSFIKGISDFVSMGLMPAGTYRNRNYADKFTLYQPDTIDDMKLLLSDAQTSGGLLIAVSHDKAYNLLKRFQEEGIEEASIIGEFKFSNEEIKIVVKK